MIRVKFQGGRELDRALGELQRRATRKAVVRKVLLAALAPFVDLAGALAPVQRVRQGKAAEQNLAHSYVAATTSKLTRRQRQAVKREGAFDVVVHAGTADPAGVQQEFGNRLHGAQPHARPAWMQTREQVFQLVLEGMRREVARAVARARKRAARAAAKRR
ncbi:hypothetical protein [Mangrovicoccus algicola]|uniref:HK97 gp10 family phage protein n=1 Tax=Mangrovicoccus algicola TaxID=2771008 RepID=A0A8J6Z7Y6_9RHOB|nr:hypothetical protein [Mangrovicoccus algicola]MBE3637466.1 hypothetical protein [Mangrovicoccus algicola]